MFFDGIDAIAPFVTQFFIIIFFIINTVLAIEQQLNLLSFRPIYHLPRWIPIFGSALCVLALIIVSPLVGLISIFLVFLFYFYLSRKKLIDPFETDWSGIFISFAEWGMRKAILAGADTNRRGWKPDMMAIFSSPTQAQLHLPLIRSIIASQGSIRFLEWGVRGSHSLLHEERSIAKKNDRPMIEKDLMQRLVKSLLRNGILASVSNVMTSDPVKAIKSVMSFAKNSFLSPNSLFLSLRNLSQKEIDSFFLVAERYNVAMILAMEKEKLSKRANKITLWVRDQSPDWKLSLNLSNLDYAILLAYQLKTVWKGELTLQCVAKEEKNVKVAIDYLEELTYLARLGARVNVKVTVGDFTAELKKASKSDIHIFGMDSRPKKTNMINIAKILGTRCLFIRDSGTGKESALV